MSSKLKACVPVAISCMTDALLLRATFVILACGRMEASISVFLSDASAVHHGSDPPKSTNHEFVDPFKDTTAHSDMAVTTVEGNA